jgi:ubiquinone/menaquinone biosynthesis C-methylase UbiE
VATDYAKLADNLLAFYNFSDKTVIAVGAGGGQLVRYGRAAAHVLALDNDAAALEELRESLKTAGLEDRFTLVLDDFYKSNLKADAVLFEFCLHEMSDPAAAVERARVMAPDVIIFDHWPGSEWSYVAAEDQKVAASWAALVRFPVKKKQRHEAVQSFKDYGELFEKVKGQGETAVSRIERYREQTGIRIPMTYGLALI